MWCNDAELKVFGRSLLQLGVCATQVAVLLEDVLDLRLDLGEQVDELDVGGEQQSSGHRWAQVVLWVQQLELHRRGGALVPCYQVAELAQYVAAHFDHVLVAGGRLQRLKHRLGRITLHVVAIDDNLDHSVPHLLRHVVAGDADQVQNHVHVPRVVGGVFLSQYGYFQNLKAMSSLISDAIQLGLEVQPNLSHILLKPYKHKIADFIVDLHPHIILNT